MPDLVWPLYQGLAGLAVGSFLGLMSLRLPQGAPVAASRSACAACGRRLGVADLVPLASFLLLRGRCRTCGAQIPRRYPALEAGCAAIGVWAGLAQPGWLGLAGALLGWQLLLLAVLDAEHFWLPRALTLGLIGSGLAAALPQGLEALRDSAIGAAAGFAALALIGEGYRRIRGREGLGGGDPWFLAGAGAWTGWAALPTVLVWACLAGLSLAAASALFGRRLALDARLPFGVFLAIGTWLAWLYGPLGRF
ncbi:MAG: prepilin peptidase [Phenylobacterium sp.]|uniref:prepilin peptidase n=1 Tax=Phenylobacterium sp. TaxID=1871053 RepID=UPI003918E772